MTPTVTAAARQLAANLETTMNAEREMPQYQSHKKVWALKIKHVELRPANGHIIHPADDGYAPFEVSDEYVQKHNPQAGGYFVVYEDGYQSWSPAEAFLGGYKAIGPKGAASPNQATEAAIVGAGASVAPYITPDDIEANIVSEFYFNPYGCGLDALRFQFLTDDHPDSEVRSKLRTLFERMSMMSTASVRAELDELMAIPGESTEALKQLTVCVLVLQNGTKVVGINYGAIDPSRHSAHMGRVEARKEAVGKIWELMGYELRSKLANG